MSDQKVEQDWETPSLEEIPVISKMHVQAMETSSDPAVWAQAGMHHVLVRTIGRKSGNEHKVALPYWRDPDGHRIVVASFAGAEHHPSWYHNLADTTANPEVLITEEGRQFWTTVDICDGDDYDATWTGLIKDRAWYANYQAKATNRRIPLVRFIEQRPAQSPAMTERPLHTLPPAGAVQDEREIEAVLAVLRSGDLLIGENVARFEDEVSTLMGKELGVMVNSGSSALLLAISLLDLEPGDEIITSVLTFSTDVAPMVQQGLVPVFVDVEPDTFQIDVNRIPEMIGPRTKAILTPNLMGNCPDWDVIRAIADEHGLLVVEDSCDVLDTRLRGTRIGTRSDISVTSFAISHSLTCAGNGGMVTMDDPELHDRCLTRRRWGRRSESYLYGTRKGQDTRWGPLEDGTMYDQIFIFDDLGYNFEPSELGAAYGLVQLTKLAEFNARRRHACDRYDDLLQHHTDKVIMPRMTPEVDSSWMRYGFILRPDGGYDRTEVQNFLEDRNVQSRMIWTGNILRQPGFSGITHRAPEDGFPNADLVMNHALSIPAHHGLGSDDIGYVVDTLSELLGN